MLSPFLVCLTEQLDKKGYGAKRQAEIVDRFNGLRERLVQQGAADPDTVAMTRTLDELDEATRIKNRLAFDALLKRAQLAKHFNDFNYNSSLVTEGKQANPGQAAVALMSADSRSGSNLNTHTLARVYKGEVWAGMDDALDKIGKGAFGTQRGKMHLDNLADEIFGQSTGDVVAAEMAKAWQKSSGMIVDLWNYAGGAMRKLDGWNLPQAQTVARVIKAGKDAWMKDHMDWLAWDRMQWPNGAPIKPDERVRVLESVYETISTNGANRIEPGDFGGQGGALGNLLDQNRFLVYKDGPTWRAQHEKYGDGNLFDVMANYVDHMTQKMGLIRVFGNNVEHGMKLAETLALQRAAATKDAKIVNDTSATLKRFQQLGEQELQMNSMNAENIMATGVNALGNLLTSAQLGSAVLAAVPMDFVSTMLMRATNHMPVLDGLIGPYAQKMVSLKEAQRLDAAAGYVWDSNIHTLFTKGRFHGFNEYGPAWSKRTADTLMRASGMNVHTDLIRSVNNGHFMNMMAADRNLDFDKLPWAPMAEKYGITKLMWDRLRAVAPFEPRPGVEMLRPIDVLKQKGARDVFERFQSMVLQEGRNMVIDTNPEANIMLKGNLRADTLPGALLHSFAMYKNFPIGLALTYGRVAMSIEGRPGRLAFVAGLGTSLLLAGAVGVQLRELAKGRDALPMDTTAFWGKSMLASGALSLWGDFLFNGVNRPGGPTEMAAGPIASFASDTTQLAFGSMFDWADKIGSLKADPNSKTPWMAKATEYASRYQPGSSLWFARAALQREIYDPLRMMADPRGAIKMDRKERKRVKDFGNESWWGPGQAFPDRAPQMNWSTP